ncbi:site-specific DNA-methyltransferase [Geobacillus sp. E263]|uniref:DNA methylase N-4/N-6 domain protein n=1 Tax=Geobacillus sp. (strain WCH70) TaxID=471223 RepID=C5D2Z4_GEOSW|nr:site-specific DNA-methyltransferase [Geobacillus sp. E263]
MKTKYEQLISLLEEMFQFDNEDLDFGIYRIMNQKREEIRKFLHQDLLPQVKQAFEKYQSVDQVNIRKELEQLKKSLQDAGVEPETSPKYKALQEKLSQSVDISVLENEVYSHLITFFGRYYDKGDFVSQRRYKKDTYAIPYEGEEVKLYWANADQYYVKTSEYFRDYSFKLPSGKKVHFVLTEASTEQDNNKEQEGKERRFILCEESPLYEEQGELYIRFVYRVDKEKQAVLNQRAIEKILRTEGYTDWIQELCTLAPTEKNKERTLLEKHLNDYTTKNTFDYFIHKDLGGFLRRELDFYIKNEIMHLDDLDTENEAQIEQYLSKIKVIKSIGHKIIKFLEQIENFQKKLWLKKKFVVETNYCVTLDRVPEELYPEIVQNFEQIEEWKRLFAIEDISGYCEPLTVEFLKSNPYLVLDTKFFDRSFVEKLLMGIDDIEGQLDGVLIRSENFQGLNLIRKRYERQAKCIYIDPPYNTGPSEILYKNNFKHSSWLSLIENRLNISKNLLKDKGVIIIAIDDYELVHLCQLVDNILPSYERNIIVVNHHPQGSGGKNISRTHEYAVVLTPKGMDILRGSVKEDYVEHRSFMRSGTAENNFRYGRPNSFYAILVDEATFEIKGIEKPPTGSDYPKGKTEEGWVRVYPLSRDGSERVWRLSYEGACRALENNGLYCSPNLTIYQVINHNKKRVTLFSNWIDKKYNAGTHGTNLISDLFGVNGLFSYPKSLYTVSDIVDASTYDEEGALIIDYFAGSGTTGHAVISLNREDNGNRKYVLIEMGEYFDTVLKPRIQKVIYSKDWKDGKPVSREGISHMFKYIRLESYEDTLNNLEIKRTEQQQLALDLMPTETREEYLLSYMLDIETKDSASLLNLDVFENPFDYKLKISDGTETTVRTVDVVETFNYLLGLTVRQMEVVQGFKVIKGELPTGERALIIWRNLKEKSNEDLERFFTKSKYNTRDNEFDYIYVNGDNHLENIKLQGDMWKVKLIEEEFKRLMFDVQDV